MGSSVRRGAADRLTQHLEANGATAEDGASIRGAENLEYGCVGIGVCVPDPNAVGPTSFYCSSLVDWAYEQVGVDLEGRGLMEGFYVTPDDLITSAFGTTVVQLVNTTPTEGDTVPEDLGGSVGIRSPGHILLTDPDGRREESPRRHRVQRDSRRKVDRHSVRRTHR